MTSTRRWRRTALLIELDIFGPGADHHAIIDGLRDTTARIITDRANIDTPAGQTALVTLYALLAMQGLRIDPDVPATPMRSSQPPLRGTSLPASRVHLVIQYQRGCQIACYARH